MPAATFGIALAAGVSYCNRGPLITSCCCMHKVGTVLLTLWLKWLRPARDSWKGWSTSAGTASPSAATASQQSCSCSSAAQRKSNLGAV